MKGAVKPLSRISSGRLLTLVYAAAIAAACTAGKVAAQTLPPLTVESVPVGSRPLGAGVAYVDCGTACTHIFALVANSADNSLSFFDFGHSAPSIVATSTISNVASPYAVVACGPKFLVTSPSDNSVTLVQVPQGTVLRTIKVGLQPRSAACDSVKAFVSNLGDNSVSVVDLNSLTVTATIPGVPGSRGLHGMAEVGSTISVAGTDANVVTALDSRNLNVVARFPIPQPVVVGNSFVASALGSVTFFNDNLQISFTLNGLPKNLQDFTGTSFRFSPVGNTYIASTGAGNSVVRIGVLASQVFGEDVIGSIPGAAALADGTSGCSPGGPCNPFVLVTSPDSNRLFIIRRRPALPSSLSMSNAASFLGAQVRNPPAGGVAPGSLAAAFVAFGASTGVSQSFSARSLPLPTSLGGVSLRVGGALAFQNSQWVYSSTGSSLAPLLFVGAGQINFQVPPDLSPADEVPAQLLRPDGSTLLSAFRVVPTAPGIFTLASNGMGQAAVVNQDGTLNFGTNPAARASFISVYATGPGATTPPLLAGEAAPASGNPLVFTQVQPTVSIGGKSARVLFSGMAPGFVGLWQINVEVPQDAATGLTVPLQISAGSVTSNVTSIAVQ